MPLTHYRTACGALFAALLLGACSSNESYLEATTLPPIVVPDGLDKQALGELYAVPAGDGRLASGELERPLPPTLSATQAIEPRVQSLGGESWLLVPKEAAATWSQLLLHLQSRRITTPKRDVFKASLETSWVTEAATIPNTAFRYQLRLEPGIQPDFTEIHAVNIQGAPRSSIPASTQWPIEPENKNHQQWLLKDIARGISRQKAVGDSLIASSIAFEPKVISTTVSGEPVLEMDLSAVRAHSALATSLKENDFFVYEENKSAAVVHFNTNNDGKKEKKKFRERLKNFLDRISSAKLTRDGLVTNRTASAEGLGDILANLPDEPAVNELFPNRRINPDAPELLNIPGFLMVRKTLPDNRQRLYIRDGSARRLEPSKAKQLLDEIKQQLF